MKMTLSEYLTLECFVFNLSTFNFLGHSYANPFLFFRFAFSFLKFYTLHYVCCFNFELYFFYFSGNSIDGDVRNNEELLGELAQLTTANEADPLNLLADSRFSIDYGRT